MIQRNVSLCMHHSCNSDSHHQKHFAPSRYPHQRQRQLNRTALYRMAPPNLKKNRDTQNHQKKPQHIEHPKPTMSLTTNKTPGPSHLHKTNNRVLPTPKSFSRQKSRTSLETAPANIDNASEIRNPRTPQQAQDDGVYGYARSMRRVQRERHHEKQANDQKPGMDQFMFLLSRDAKENDKEEQEEGCKPEHSAARRDGVLSQSESRGRERGVRNNVSGIISNIVQKMRHRASQRLVVFLVGLILTVVIAACQEHWLPMMDLRAMRWQ
jgi:hypothetical protein